MRVLFAAAAAVLVAATPVVAFEFQGYVSGMSLEDIAAVATAQGDTLVESDTSIGGVAFEGFYTVLRPDGEELSLSLCADRLHSVYTVLDGGFHEFAEMAMNLTGKYGPPASESQSTPPEDDVPTTSSFSLFWTTPEGEEVSIYLDAQGDMAPLTSYGMSAIATVCPAAVDDGTDKTAT